MILNGQTFHLAEPATIMELLIEAGFEAGRVAVMRNGEIVPRTELAECVVTEDDNLEVVSFVGGG